MDAPPSPTRPPRRAWWVLVAVFLALAPNVYHRSLPGPRHASDFTVYTAAGAVMLAGGDPSTAVNPRGCPYVYPPLAGLLLAPFAPLPYTAQTLLWLALSLVICGGCWAEMLRLHEHLAPADSGRWPVVAAGLAVVQPALMTLRFGQINLVLLYALLLGWRLLVTGERPALGGLSLALPCALKVTPTAAALAVLLGQTAPRVRRSAWLGFVGGSLALWLALPAAVVGWQHNLDYLRTFARNLPDPALNQWCGAPVGGTKNQCLDNALRIAARRLAGEPGEPRPERRREPLPRCAAPLKGLLALVLLAAGGVLLARGGPRAGAALVGLAALFALVAAPLAWMHHFVALVPAALGVPCYLLERGRPRAARALSGSLVLLVWANEAWLSHVGGLGLGAALWFVVAALLVMV